MKAKILNEKQLQKCWTSLICNFPCLVSLSAWHKATRISAVTCSKSHHLRKLHFLLTLWLDFYFSSENKFRPVERKECFILSLAQG